MLKFILLFSVLCVFFTETNPSATSVARHYCSMRTCPRGTSSACAFTRSSALKCNGVLLRLPRRKILHWHNARRNLIALGRIRGFQSSRRMGKMRWSTQLEQMAEYNVKKCVFKHDKCRNTNVFTKSGQNLFKKTFSKKTSSTASITEEGVKAWFSEYKNSNQRQMNSYYTTKKPTGHFSVMVKYDNNRIGCAASKFKSNGKTVIIFACNYATTNIVKRPIYAKGRPGSRCKTGRSKSYRGLCTSNEYFPH